MRSGLSRFVTCKKQVLLALFLFIAHTIIGQQTATTIQFVYTSDAHYGLSRLHFRGDSNVDAHMVNAAMIKQINTLPGLILPAGKGVNAGKKAGAIDYLIQTGDIANRMEIPYQSAASSWKQFETDYIQGVTLKNRQQQPATIYVLPGNHDISNAIGHFKPMHPATDATAMVSIYNSMMKPATPKTNATYQYATDKVHYSFNANGIHFLFINLWPDSSERIWMQQDLKTVDAHMPVILFCHDQPTCEAKHFTNPVPPHSINASGKFENLATEYYKEGNTAAGDDANTDLEQRGWVAFLKAHPNIKAYFHGHSNYNEFYVYKGPDHDVALHTFRVDSPMKGKLSSKDETLLSFQLVSINSQTQEMTVRECLWNTNPAIPSTPLVFGSARTISLKVK
jgi:predicted MPP superfamily phosphohydrolase